MAEIVQPGVLKTPRPRRKLARSEIIFFGVILVVIIILGITLANKLTLKHDVSAARAVADKAIADVDKRDGNAVHNLGSSKFQSQFSADLLTKEFKAVTITTSSTPTLDRQIAPPNASPKAIYFIYKYPAHLAKLPYFIRIVITNVAGKWQLTNISGNADESQLIVQ